MPNEMSAETWNAVISVNLLAPLQFTLELLPSLAAQGGGHILNVCSLLGLVPGRKLASYQTSKFGLVGFSLGLRTACFVQSIGVTALCPGLVDTPMLEQMGPRWLKESISLGPLSPVVSAELVARHAIASIRNNRGIVVISLSGKLLWLIYRMLPTLFLWLFCRRFRLRPRRR